MRNSPDPAIHRQREEQFIAHVEKLLGDDRLRIDTIRGRRPLTDFPGPTILRTDKGVEVKRMLMEAGKPDRDFQNALPQGHSIDIALTQRRWWILKKPAGRLVVMVVSPTRELIAGQPAPPMETGAVRKLLSEIPPPVAGEPTTVVICSTSGFTIEAHELAVRSADRTVLLVEPNDAGGWQVSGPVETKALADLFDPEVDTEKRKRLTQAIEAAQFELQGAGLAADRLATKTELPITFVESELKSYARQHPGLVAKRLDGRVVLFREGWQASTAGGSDMPLVDRLKSLFGGRGDNEKKIAFLSERRAALSQQRDRAYEELSSFESREVDLKTQFKNAGSELTKRRITSQLLQLRKDMERRQQLLGVLNQQINVVSTHLHTLELMQTGQAAKLPDSEEMAEDAAKAEEMLAELQATTEIATGMAVGTGTGLSEEEQALFEELERETGGGETAPAQPEPTGEAAEPARPEPTQPAAARPTPKRAEPEAG
jgi:hypothetical protein